MEKKGEINFTIILIISFFIHAIIGIGILFPDLSTVSKWKKSAETLFESASTIGGRDIIANINQDDKRIVKPQTLLSDRDSSAKGYITKESGDRWLNNSLDFKLRRGMTGEFRDKSGRLKAERMLLATESSLTISLISEDDFSSLFGEGGESDFTRIPDKNGFSRKNAIYYSNDGRFSFNTLKFKNFRYFKHMKDTISSNWNPPQMANTVMFGYAPGKTRIMAIPNQEVWIYFGMNRKGDVLYVKIFQSLNNRYLDDSCVEAIKNSVTFGPVPDDIVGETIIIPIVFGYYVY